MLDKQEQRIDAGLVEPQRSGRLRVDAEVCPARERHTRRLGRLDRRVARAAEPRRDDYQGITMNCQDHLYRICIQSRSRAAGSSSSAVSAWARSRWASCWRKRLRRRRSARAKKPHFAPKAKRVIFLFMAGAPSHLELFDYKPQLAKFDGTLPPAELLKGYRAAFINPNSKLLGPKFKFRQVRPERRGAVRAAAAHRARSSTTSPS